ARTQELPMSRPFLGHDRKLRSLRRSVPAPSRRQRSCRPRLERLEDRLAPATHTWTGAVNVEWTYNQNWREEVAPYQDTDADLVFPEGNIGYFTSIHDIHDPVVLPIRSIAFDGDRFLVNARYPETSILLSQGIHVTGAGS